MTTWLTLSDYSAKFDVSVSTLRRRLKAGKVEFKFEDGKYMLRDCPLDEHNPNTQFNHHQNGSAPFAPPQESLGVAEPISHNTDEAQQTPVQAAVTPGQQNEDSGHFWVTVNAMMNELKKAYRLILQEKEEQILQLKDEHSDLRTLIRVLEEENKRLKKLMTDTKSVDSWLERSESL